MTQSRRGAERKMRGSSRKCKNEMRERKERWRDGAWGGGQGGLMCPSWGEAAQKWLSVELN